MTWVPAIIESPIIYTGQVYLLADTAGATASVPKSLYVVCPRISYLQDISELTQRLNVAPQYVAGPGKAVTLP